MMKRSSYILRSGRSAMMNGFKWTVRDFEPHKIQLHSKFLRTQNELVVSSVSLWSSERWDIKSHISSSLSNGLIE